MTDPGPPADADVVHADHDSHDAHLDDDHDDHGPIEDPRWVLIPLVAGLAIGLLVAIVLGLGSGASVV